MSFGKGTICTDYVQHSDSTLYAPEYDVSLRSGEVQAAYSEYRLYIDILIQAAVPIVNGCRLAFAESQTAQRVFGSVEAGTGR